MINKVEMIVVFMHELTKEQAIFCVLVGLLLLAFAYICDLIEK